ncbi:MAG: hypothetical protein J6R91_04605 [Bacteroidaceae bacterium]|nr:hypothetical protein [Bacteroidaceae bacterium]
MKTITKKRLLALCENSLTLLSQLRKAMQGVQTHATLADKVTIVQVHPENKKILRNSQDFLFFTIDIRQTYFLG